MHLRHRHFLGIPVFLFFLGTAMFWDAGNASLLPDTSDATTAPAAGAISARGGDEEFSLPRGIYGLLQEDGMLEDDGVELSIRDGAALFASDGMARVRMGDVIVSGFHGGFLASNAGSRLSIFALTAPVLLQRDEFRLIIPAGMRGEWAAGLIPGAFSPQIAADAGAGLSVLNTSVMRDELQRLSRLRPTPPLQVAGDASFRMPWLPLVFPAAEERMRLRGDGARLSRLLEALRSGDQAKARTQLEDEGVRRLVRSDDLPSGVFQALLASSAGLPSISRDILAETRDGDLWVLASFHPDFAAAAWEAPVSPAIPRPLRLLRLLQLPSSDTGPAAPERAVARWTAQLKDELDAAAPAGRAGFMHALLTTMRDYMAFAEVGGFPERTGRYAASLRQIIGRYAPELTREDYDLYAPWEAADVIAPYIEPPTPAAPVPSAVNPAVSESTKTAQEASFDADAAEARAKQFLHDAGALFTTQTSVRAESAGRVAVQNIIFASADGDRAYDFIFDQEKNEALDIRREKELLPYPMRLEAFAKWAGDH